MQWVEKITQPTRDDRWDNIQGWWRNSHRGRPLAGADDRLSVAGRFPHLTGRNTLGYSVLWTRATHRFRGTSLLAQSLEWGKPLAKRFHHGDLLTERAAGHVTAAPPLTLGGVGYIRAGRFGPFPRNEFILEGSGRPRRGEN